MAAYPAANQDSVPAAKKQQSIRPVMVILHTFAGPKGGGFQRPDPELRTRFIRKDGRHARGHRRLTGGRRLHQSPP